MLIDESGFYIKTLVRRTWAPRGQTPVLPSWGRHRDKVSVAVAVSVSPAGKHLGLSWYADPKTYVTAETMVGFLRNLLKHLRGKVIVIWDGGSSHKGPLIRALCARFARLHLERLPAYAPDLNPVEQVWSHLKHARLANFVPRHVRHLDEVVRSHLHTLSQASALLKQLWQGSKLPFPSFSFA